RPCRRRRRPAPVARRVTAAGRITGGLVAAGAALALGMLLLGLPGMVIVEFVGPLAGPSGLAAFHGDKAWPAAIRVTELAPLGIVASALALAAVRPGTRVAWSVVWGLVGYVTMGVAAVLVLIADD